MVDRLMPRKTQYSLSDILLIAQKHYSMPQKSVYSKVRIKTFDTVCYFNDQVLFNKRFISRILLA